VKIRVTNIILIISCLLIFRGVGGQTAYAFAGDTTEYQIVFECDILYNGTPIDQNIRLSVEGRINDSLWVTGQAYSEVDTSMIIYLDAPSYFNLIENHQLLKYSLNNIERGCYSNNIVYSLDYQKSKTNLLVINQFEIKDHFFTFPDSIYCKNSGIIIPHTDIPLEFIELFSPNGIVFSPDKGINTDKSVPGYYNVNIITDFCLSANDTLDIVIQEQSNYIFPDTLVYCANTVVDQIDSFDYEFFSANDTGLDELLNDFSGSGYYMAKLKNGEICSSSEVVYVDLIEPISMSINQDELCEKVHIEVIPDEPGQYSYNWSNGLDTPVIDMTETSTLTLNVTDENGCITAETVEVQYSPFIVESVGFEKEESDCWQDGKFNVNSINVNFDSGEYKYTLINTITGNRVGNLQEVPEGIYQLEIADSRDCKVNYSEEITILQNCLNDYPVFTPDQDGIEDEYFIPHNGTVKIFDRNGVMLKELKTPAYWDGTDDSGNQVPMGNYVMLTEEGRVVNITIVR
jgi:hypothetical protein